MSSSGIAGANQTNSTRQVTLAKANGNNHLEPSAQIEASPVQQEGQTSSTSEMTKRTAKQYKKWNRRLKIFFCCLGYKKNKDSIADVASIFAEYYADLDVPSSSFAAGFVLLSKYQAAQRDWIIKNQQLNIKQFLSSVPITNETKFLDLSTSKDSHLINDLIYYMNYSLAIFGWPLQVVDDPCTLCCIYPYLSLSSCCKGRQDKPANPKTEEPIKSNDEDGNNPNNVAKDETLNRVQRKESVVGQLDDDCNMPIVLEDNCCGCNVASAERRLRAHNYEIIYVSYKVNVNMVPFLVAADHSKQTIVVAMRGSMSMADMVTDMNGQTDKLPIDDCPDDWLCHRGITRAAEYVKATLIEEQILDRAFNCRPDLGSNDYTLVLCGHSLGAGVAAILGILLRDRYPTLKSYLYSPPGGILSLPAVEYTKQFAIGTLLGNDVVPRLGIAQLERLRYHVLLSSKSSNKSASRILTRALCPSFCCGSNNVEYDPSQSLDLLHGKGGRPFDYNGSKVPFQVQPHLLYVPGRLIHIVKNYSFKAKTRRIFKEPIYQAIWTENTDYDRVLIGEGMFYDHLPNHLMHSMKMLFSNTLPARKESDQSNNQNHVQDEDEEEEEEARVAADCGSGENISDSADNITTAIINHLSEELKKENINAHDDNNNFNYDANNNDTNNDMTTPSRNGIPDDDIIGTEKVAIDELKLGQNQSDAKSLDNNGNYESIPNRNSQ